MDIENKLKQSGYQMIEELEIKNPGGIEKAKALIERSKVKTTSELRCFIEGFTHAISAMESFNNASNKEYLVSITVAYFYHELYIREKNLAELLSKI